MDQRIIIPTRKMTACEIHYTGLKTHDTDGEVMPHHSRDQKSLSMNQTLLGSRYLWVFIMFYGILFIFFFKFKPPFSEQNYFKRFQKKHLLFVKCCRIGNIYGPLCPVDTGPWGLVVCKGHLLDWPPQLLQAIIFSNSILLSTNRQHLLDCAVFYKIK